jgi:RimJ/RimL family protein N-acetyltransferase
MTKFHAHSLTISTHNVEIVPLAEQHFEAYFEAFSLDPHTMALYSHPPKSPSREDVHAFFVGRMTPPDITQAFVFQDKILGTSSYYNISDVNHSVEIGYTWIAAPFRGTNLNPIVKLAMIQAAFEDFGAVRVQFVTSHKNFRSQKAMENIGLVREGTLRQDRLIHDGTWRDTVYFSVIKSEWPAMKARLQELIRDRTDWRTVTS